MDATAFAAFTEPVALLRRSPGLFLPNEGVFTRLFPGLPPYEPGGKDPVSMLHKHAKTIYDRGAGDNTYARNLNFPAAYTFFAQFVAHDMSFDPSRFGQRSVDAVQHANMRTPRLDLDNVYGGDPDLNPLLYEFDAKRDSTCKFRIARRKVSFKSITYMQEDLPRLGGSTDEQRDSSAATLQERALIPDQRDDQHVIISQLHLAFLKLHNVEMDQLSASSKESPRALFFKAQKLVRWRYQYVIVNDLLPRMLGEQGLATFKAGLDRWQKWQQSMGEPPYEPAVPIEFSVGAYRVAHSSLRKLYRVNGKVDAIPLFPTRLPSGKKRTRRPAEPKNLMGFGPPHPGLAVSWDRLLVVPGREDLAQHARVFNTKLPQALAFVPGAMQPGGLAELDQERSLRLGIPSGQSIALRLGATPQQIQPGNDSLWYYCLKEVRNGGQCVGPVAAAIISKVFLDLLHLDPTSYLYQQPSWIPPYSDPTKPRNALAELLMRAKMPFSDDLAFEPVMA